MKTDSPRLPCPAALPLLLTLLSWFVACGAPVESDPDPAAPPLEPGQPPEAGAELEPELPWPDTFQSPALLIADEIRVEGPKGLLGHIATRIEPDHHTYETKTLPEGFRQSFELREPDSDVEIRAYLDASELVALKRLVLLERPGDVDVVVVARGDVYWRDKTTGAERRGPTLTLRGE